MALSVLLVLLGVSVAPLGSFLLELNILEVNEIFIFFSPLVSPLVVRLLNGVEPILKALSNFIDTFLDLFRERVSPGAFFINLPIGNQVLKDVFFFLNFLFLFPPGSCHKGSRFEFFSNKVVNHVSVSGKLHTASETDKHQVEYSLLG